MKRKITALILIFAMAMTGCCYAPGNERTPFVEKWLKLPDLMPTSGARPCPSRNLPGSPMRSQGEETMIEFLFLDLDDTILDFHRSEAVAIRETFEKLGIEVTDAVVARYSQINKKMWEKLEDGLLNRQQVLEYRFEELFGELGISCSGYEAQKIYEHQLSLSHFFMPQAEELLEQLKGKYRLFLASNGTGKVQDGRFTASGILPYFEDVFISERMGQNKPAKEFFDLCFARIPGFDRERAIMIGDSLSSDIRGGINAGIRTCWYNPKALSGREDMVPDHEIRELLELPELLEKIFAR